MKDIVTNNQCFFDWTSKKKCPGAINNGKHVCFANVHHKGKCRCLCTAKAVRKKKDLLERGIYR